MDDVSWSEPAPRGRRASAELNPPTWLKAAPTEPETARPPDRASGETSRSLGGFHVTDYLGESGATWVGASFDEPEVIDYTDALDEEEIWGPRPKLQASESGGRRTVVITGRVADRHIAPRTGSRDSRPGRGLSSFQADRTAMWAVLLCVIVLLAAVASH